MALAGVGNPVGGSNPSGTGSSINYITVGDKTFAYGMSGNISVTGQGTGEADTNLLNFNTGGEFIDAELTVGLDTEGDVIVSYEMIMNGEIIYAVKWDAGGPSGFVIDVPVKFIIPPFTDFVLKVGINATRDMSVILRGEVYA